MAVRVFLCYAHNDEELLNELKKHLMPLVREGRISLWHDQDINAGREWESEAVRNINSSQIILLLISSNFIASDYHYNVEMRRAMGLHESGKACVIPVILRPVLWKGTPFTKLKALPENALPVTDPSWGSRDKAWENVAEGIEKVIGERFSTDHVPGNRDAERFDSNTLRATVVLPPLYKRKNTLTSKIHGCDIRFTLSQSHLLQYTFEWNPFNLNPFSGNRFILWLDGLKLVDKKKMDMTFVDEHFKVENVEGMIFCYHEGKRIMVLIKIGETVVFEKNDTWASVK